MTEGKVPDADISTCEMLMMMTTYIDLVFAVSDADIVEQRGFVQVHERTCREKHDTQPGDTQHCDVAQHSAKQQSRTLTVVLHMFVDIVFSRKHLVYWSQERLRRSTEKEVRGAERGSKRR